MSTFSGVVVTWACPMSERQAPRLDALIRAFGSGDTDNDFFAKLLGVSPSQWSGYRSHPASMPRHIRNSLEAHARLATRSPHELHALAAARGISPKRARARMILGMFLLLSIVTPPPASAAPAGIPMFLDASIDGIPQFCFDTTSVRVGPMGTLPLKITWDCASTGQTRHCYRIASSAVPFTYFVNDRYIAITCTAAEPPPPPPSAHVFADGFEPTP